MRDKGRSERPKEKNKEGEEVSQRSERRAHSELGSGEETKTETAFGIEVVPVDQGPPAAMGSDCCFWYSGKEHSGGTTSAEGVPSVRGRVVGGKSFVDQLAKATNEVTIKHRSR
jgi:hypothetical protein